MNNDRADGEERFTCQYRWIEEADVVLFVVVALEMVVCGGWEKCLKVVVVVAAAYVRGLLLLPEVIVELMAWKRSCRC